MKKLLLLTLSIITTTVGMCQKANETVAINYVDSLFSPGEHKLEILEKNIPADLKEIIVNYRKAIADSLQWYDVYSQQHKNEVPLPYHANFGITKADYDRMNTEFPAVKMKVKTVKGITVNKLNGQLALKGKGDFTILDEIIFDVANKSLIIGDQHIPYTGEINESEGSGIGAWNGYDWKLEVGSMADVKAFKSVDYTMIDLSIGKPQTENKIALQYKTIYVIDGDPKINGSLTAFLK